MRPYLRISMLVLLELMISVHVDRRLECNCAVCGEFLQNSTKAVVYPKPCGHAIHSRCRIDYIQNSHVVSCPICNKTYEEFRRPELYRFRERQLEQLQVPHAYSNWKNEVNLR